MNLQQSKLKLLIALIFSSIALFNLASGSTPKKPMDLEYILNQTAITSLSEYADVVSSQSSQPKSYTVDRINDEASNFIATNGRTSSLNLVKLFQKTRKEIVKVKGLSAGAQTTDMDIAYAVQSATEKLNAIQ